MVTNAPKKWRGGPKSGKCNLRSMNSYERMRKCVFWLGLEDTDLEDPRKEDFTR